jgi:hypothetical protein
MPAQQSHTFAGRAFLFEEKYTNKNRTASGKPAKECVYPALKKKFSKMPHERLKRRTKTMGRTDKYGLLSRLTLWTEQEEARCPNNVYVAIAGEVVNRRSVLLSDFVLNGQVNASNPLLHIHANRYRSV